MNFKLPEVEPYYQLIGANVSFNYDQTSGVSAYNVYVMDTEKDLESITPEEKPEKRQALAPIKATSESATSLTYASGNIDVNAISEETLTLSIESETELSSGEYLAVPMTASATTEQIWWYEKVLGLEDDYSMESFEIGGATAYVNNGTGALTAVFDVASVNAFLELPFEASLIYNDYYEDVLEGAGIQSYMGKNFKLNFQQYIVQRGDVYELIDADGSISTFNQLGENNYYCKEKDLTYRPSREMVIDLTGNELHFENNRLTKIVSGNNYMECIEILYTSSTSTKISQICYSVIQSEPVAVITRHRLNFHYSNANKVSAITTTEGYQVAFEYEDDYLVGIYNTTGVQDPSSINQGVRTILLGYNNDIYTSETKPLNYVYNNQKEGIIFYKNYDGKIYQVRNMNGLNNMGINRCCSYVSFGYYGIYTKIYYYQNGLLTGNKYVAFNNNKKVISEWQQNSKGIISVSTSNAWMSESAMEGKDYTKETCSYYHKSLPSNSFVVNPNGGSVSQVINSKWLGDIEKNDNCKYAVVFQVAVSDLEDELSVPLKLSVKIGNKSAQKIELERSGHTYIALLCDYYTNDTTVKIQNNGTEDIIIDYFNYALVDCSQETRTYYWNINEHQTTSMATYAKSGAYQQTTYDWRQRVETVKTQDETGEDSLKTTTYTYYSFGTDYQRGKLQQIRTVDTQGVETENIQYDYSGDWKNYTETTVATHGALKTKSSVNRTITNEGIIVTETDENNIQTKGYYEITNGDFRLVKLEYGNTREQYGYNNLGQIASVNVYEKATNLLKYSQTDNYDANGVYLGSTYGGNTYTYGYEDTGFVTSIGVNGLNTPLLQYTYNGDGDTFGSNQLSYKTYANGNVETYDYLQPTTGNRIVKEYKSDSSSQADGTYTYNYNGNGQMTNQSVKIGNNVAVKYDYGELDNLEERTLTITGLHYHTEYTNYYNTQKNRVERVQLFSVYSCMTTNNYRISYEYNDEGQVSEMDYGTYNAEYGYDKLGRLTTRTVPYGYMDIQEERYVYKTYTVGDTTYTTNQLLRIEDGALYNGEARTATYDNNGYITSIGYNDNTYTYEYDGAGRLTRENSTQYEYNDKNNLIKKTANGVVTNYTYDSYNRLTSDGTNDYTYDLMGNPVIYKGNTFTWEQGRKLASGSMNGNSFTYNYDGNGMRYKKVVNGSKTEYYWNGSQLLYESRDGDRIYYIYGVTGIEGMIVESGWQDSIYYFDKNTLGDIVAIRDSSGNIVATYEYDAWGNVTVMDEYGYANISSSFIGNVNPFRYRGYYYDTETGFYYLQTRYYDPTIMRFINADNYELVATLSSSHELNLYAYCGNNPIMYTDETGEGFFLIACLVGVIVGATFGAVDAAASGENILASAVIDGIVGGLIGGFSLGFGWTVAISTGANMIEDFINYEKINIADSVMSGLGTGIGSLINTNAMGLINNKFFSKIADETLSNISSILLEDFLNNMSFQLARRVRNPFSFWIGIPSY